MNKTFKRFAIFIIALTGFTGTYAQAQESHGFFNHVSVGVGAGSYGIDVEAAVPVGKMFALRCGVGFLPNFSINTDVNASVSTNGVYNNYPIDIKGKLQRTQGKVLVNFYPMPKIGLFVTAGAYFGGDKLIKIEGHSDKLKEDYQNATSAGIVIGDKEIPVDENGNVAGGLKVASFRPYVGIGYGRAIPNKRCSFMVEAGVQFHGTPEIYTSNGQLLTPGATNSDDKFTKIVDKLKVYPVLNFKLNTRIL